MNSKNSNLYLFLLGLLFILISACSNPTKKVNIETFKGIKLFITQAQFKSYLDSLVNNDPAFNVVNYRTYRYCEFIERSELYPGNIYYGYIIPTYTSNILTKLTIFYSPMSYPENVTSYIQGESQSLLYWGSGGNVNKVHNDINLKLQLKYGSQIRTGNSASPHNYTYKFSEWESKDLSVSFLQEVVHDDGLNNYTFCNLLVEYVPTDKFLNDNKNLIKDIISENSIY